MRIVSFVHEGRRSFGVVRQEEVIDAATLGHPDLSSLLEAGELDRLRSCDGERIPLRDILYLPVVTRPRKILCVGVNYDAHRVEMGRDRPSHPVIFTRFATTLVGHQRPILRPKVSERLDYEGELAVVIGRRARHVASPDALSFIAGYTCFNDASVRDWQRHTSQFTPGKNFDQTGAIGPWLVTSDELGEPSNRRLTTRLNGQEVQSASTSDMTFTIQELLAYITTFTTLEPGDVIATGTPSGVGDKRDPPLYMRPKDLVEVEIEGIGTLANPIEQEIYRLPTTRT